MDSLHSKAGSAQNFAARKRGKTVKIDVEKMTKGLLSHVLSNLDLLWNRKFLAGVARMNVKRIQR
jgi:hypothetical protein